MACIIYCVYIIYIIYYIYIICLSMHIHTHKAHVLIEIVPLLHEGLFG